ncbi:ABC transporter permease subunit [Thermosynechococcaceae cyanobacterium BACA0444]|uniref:ABC transporter permease subunit n=1 Tax=Pseudocalidococcus azoricus BACA0444 TaxID=2918990 RepID=A0AAE4FV36_9CYAN|nr:ABC transporter permease subunit [Pseudocalidococcus azoricus]MDS3862102.1 ABC transporter permease subunit [Pseudocalidococcus azoricus BACA0444]
MPIVSQALALAVFGGLLYFFWDNLSSNLQRLNLTPGFGFLNFQASFSIGESIISYRPTQSYWRALLVGLLNSLRVIGASLVLATVIGLAVGIGRWAQNWLVRQLAFIYVEILRNTPLLLQLFFWYFAIFLSQGNKSSNWGLFQLSQQGIELPFSLVLSPEFSALWLGLAIYTSTFIAEIVRGGIQSVPKGQWEAAHSLGLPSLVTLWLVIIPQAMRAIIPPLGNQYLNLAKNSSLAIAVGYPDLYAVASTTYNQTGRALEVMALIMASYLSLSLIIAAVVNYLNRRMQLVSH